MDSTSRTLLDGGGARSPSWFYRRRHKTLAQNASTGNPFMSDAGRDERALRPDEERPVIQHPT